MSWKIAMISLSVVLAASSAFAEIDEKKLLDLTYPLDEQAVFWPTNKPFTWQKAAWGKTAKGYWYASGDFSMSEHGGTHIDAPIHFGEGKQSVDAIPLQNLVAPAVVIDARAAVEAVVVAPVEVEHDGLLGERSVDDVLGYAHAE